ncbi:hypothetical protein QZH45_09600 [Pseudomonas corrugata]|uniref:hypothetical protein n=1 Tax=Pseudomonas corrugata TaxID=47879 RepID=UPI003D812F08
MTDYTELKRLADELVAANDLFNESPQDNEVGDTWSVANDRFTEAASPEAILALIAERDQLKAENEALRDGASFRAIQSLRQDCEALRKALGDCADELSAEIICKHGGQKLEDMHPVTRRLYERDMAAVTEARAAMGQGGQS